MIPFCWVIWCIFLLVPLLPHIVLLLTTGFPHLSLWSRILFRAGEGRAALPLADGWHHFFAKQLD